MIWLYLYKHIISFNNLINLFFCGNVKLLSTQWKLNSDICNKYRTVTYKYILFKCRPFYFILDNFDILFILYLCRNLNELWIKYQSCQRPKKSNRRIPTKNMHMSQPYRWAYMLMSCDIWKISKYCAKMIFICSLIFLFLSCDHATKLLLSHF